MRAPRAERHAARGAERIDDSPRASTTQPPTLEILAELGLIDEYLRVGLVSRTFQFWDRPTRSSSPSSTSRASPARRLPFVVQTEQHKLANMAIAGCAAWRTRKCNGSAVVGLDPGREPGERADGEQTYSADYVIAADGGSTVRKLLDIEFEGYTWPERFLVITTKFDFQAALGCCLRNYMADPQEWTNLFKVAGDDLKGRWRAVFNTREDESDEEALSDAAVRARLRASTYPSASAITCISISTRCTSAWRELPQGTRVPVRRCRARQQPDRRPGAEQRHPRGLASRRLATPRAAKRAGRSRCL